MQDIVVGNKTFTDVTKPSEIVQLLLNDEQLATLNASAASNLTTNKTGGISGDGEEPVQDLWNDEEDSFFGHSAPTAPSIAPDGDDVATPMPTSTRGRKRKPGMTGGSRGRKPAGKKKLAAAVPAGLDDEGA